MVDEQDFINHHMTKKRNPLSPTAAQVEWDKMVLNPKAHFHDRKGADGALRFRVSMKDVVTFRSRFTSARTIEAEEKNVKNPTDTALSNMRQQVINGTSGVSLEDDEFDSVAKAMVSSGSGVGGEDGMLFEGAFMGANIHSIRGLADDSSEQGELDADEEMEDGDSGNGSKKDKEKKKKKDKDVKKTTEIDQRQVADACAKAQRLWSKGITGLTSSMEEVKVMSDTLLRGNVLNRDNQHLRNAYNIAELRIADVQIITIEHVSDLMDVI